MARIDPDLDYLSGVASTTPDHELARAVARQRLASHLTDDPVAPLADSVRLGKAVGLTIAEMRRLTGVAKQTMYRQVPNDKGLERRPSGPQERIEVLVMLGHDGGWATPALLARSAALSEPSVTATLTSLHADGLCAVRSDGYTNLEGAPTAATFRVLREHFDDLYLRRPEYYLIYVRIPPRHHAAIVQAALEVLSAQRHEQQALARSVAPSLTDGPELAFQAAAPTARSAIALTRDLWRDIHAHANIPHSEPMITNTVPPAPHATVPNHVLDTFLDAIVAAGAPGGDVVRRIRGAYAGGATDRELTGRCVTMAALALRKTVGNNNEPRAITDGDSAFAEWQPAHAIRVDRAGEQVKAPAVAALDLATEHLGPLPGGRLGSVRHPDHPPVIVETRRPTQQELIDIARHAGEAVGAAAALGQADAAEAMQRVVVPGGAVA